MVSLENKSGPGQGAPSGSCPAGFLRPADCLTGEGRFCSRAADRRLPPFPSFLRAHASYFGANKGLFYSRGFLKKKGGGTAGGNDPPFFDLISLLFYRTETQSSSKLVMVSMGSNGATPSPDFPGRSRFKRCHGSLPARLIHNINEEVPYIRPRMLNQVKVILYIKAFVHQDSIRNMQLGSLLILWCGRLSTVAYQLITERALVSNSESCDFDCRSKEMNYKLSGTSFQRLKLDTIASEEKRI